MKMLQKSFRKMAYIFAPRTRVLISSRAMPQMGLKPQGAPCSGPWGRALVPFAQACRPALGKGFPKGGDSVGTGDIGCLRHPAPLHSITPLLLLRDSPNECAVGVLMQALLGPQCGGLSQGGGRGGMRRLITLCGPLLPKAAS